MSMIKAKYVALASVIIMLAVAGMALAMTDDSDADDAKTLSFNANGGTGAPATLYSTDASVYDATYGWLLPTAIPTRDGYTFEYWCFESATNQGLIFYASTAEKSNHAGALLSGTMYAIWSQPSSTDPAVTVYSYTLKYDANGGSDAPSTQTATSTNTIHSFTIPSTAPTKSGYTFEYWWDSQTDGGVGQYYAAGATFTITSTAPTITLHAVWTARTCTVTFDANGGTGTMASQSFTYGTSQALRANAFTFDGHNFDGWATSASGALVYTDMQTVNLGTVSTLTLYAHWTGTTPTDVTPVPSFEYEKSGMTVTFKDTSTNASIWAWSFGDTLTSTTQSPEHTYTKSGDYTVALTVTSTTGTTATTSQIVTVGGDPDTTYTVVFDVNGGSAVESMKATGGSSITLPSSNLSGKTFVAWFIGDAQAGVAGAEYQVAGDVTLTAHWADGTVTTYHVSFYLVDGGTQTLDCSQTVISGGKATYYLPSSPGESYSGWYTSTDWKAKYSFSSPVSSDLSLYCKVTHISTSVDWATAAGYVCAIFGAICAVAAVAVMPLLGIPAVMLFALAGVCLWLL